MVYKTHSYYIKGVLREVTAAYVPFFGMFICIGIVIEDGGKW